MGVACGAHVLHDGYTDLLYVLLPLRLGIVPPRVHLAYRLVNAAQPWAMAMACQPSTPTYFLPWILDAVATTISLQTVAASVEAR